MKIFYPYKIKPTVTQGFSKNLNTYYAEGGLLGHTGVDMWREHGTEILCGVGGYVYQTLNQGNPDPMRYRGVYTIVEEDGVAYEVSYGHLGEIFVNVGDTIKVGDKIGTQSNTGDVASWGNKVTKAMKLAGSTAGSHLHFQVRLLKKVDKKEKGKNYLNQKINGSYYEIPLYKNGFNGCIDPSQFIQEQTAYEASNSPLSILLAQVYAILSPKITKTLKYGMRGDEVKILQRKLNIKDDGVFGVMTEKSVKEFQKANNLSVDGIVGRQTIGKLFNY